MTDLIDTYLLKSGMEKRELCAIKHREAYYIGITLMAGLTLMALSLAIFAPIQP